MKRSAEMINPHACYPNSKTYGANDTGLIPYAYRKQNGSSVALENLSYSWTKSGVTVSKSFKQTTSFGYGAYYGKPHVNTKYGD